MKKKRVTNIVRCDKRDKEIMHQWMQSLSDGCDEIMANALTPKSKTDINNFKDPYYSVVLHNCIFLPH